MGDQFAGFTPEMPKRMIMPPGYELEGICGEGFSGKRYVAYYWFIKGTSEFGDDQKNRTAAVKDAWRHWRDIQAAQPAPPQPEQAND